jgi:thymidine kinase
MTYEVTVVCDQCGKKELARTEGFVNNKGGALFGDSTILPRGWGELFHHGHKLTLCSKHCETDFRTKSRRHPE